MTRQKAIQELVALQHDGDYESTHSDADRVLCDLLVALGYAERCG